MSSDVPPSILERIVIFVTGIAAAIATPVLARRWANRDREQASDATVQVREIDHTESLMEHLSAEVERLQARVENLETEREAWRNERVVFETERVEMRRMVEDLQRRLITAGVAL